VIRARQCVWGHLRGQSRGVHGAVSQRAVAQNRVHTDAPLSRNVDGLAYVPPTRCIHHNWPPARASERHCMTSCADAHSSHQQGCSVVLGYMACIRCRSSLASAAGGTRQLHRAERSAHWHIPLIPPTWADWAATTPAGGAQHPYAPRCTAYGTAAGGCTPGASMKGVGLTGVTLCNIVGRPCGSPLAFAAVSNCVNAVP
jgi:hypothetical protein